MKSKMNNPCWLKYCHVGMSKVPAPGTSNQMKRGYGISVRGSGYLVTSNVVSITPTPTTPGSPGFRPRNALMSDDVPLPLGPQVAAWRRSTLC